MAKAKRKAASSMADTADRHDLYQQSVQCPEAEIDFLLEQFAALRRRTPRVIREDFCGTAYTACEWVRRDKKNRAIGVDLDAEVLQWGRERNVGKLGKTQRARISLLCADVLEANTPPVDAVLAMNFSYWVLRTRETAQAYFERVYQALEEDGLFFLDCYGGYEAPKELKEKRKLDNFTYVWHQADFDPVSGEMECRIHFHFPDKSKLKKAFTYTWRLWTLPEIRELLAAAGFRATHIYWEQADEESGEGNGEFKKVSRGDADPGWVTYIVAEK